MCNAHHVLYIRILPLLYLYIWMWYSSVVRAPDCHCKQCIGPGLGHSIFPRSKILGRPIKQYFTFFNNYI